MKKLSLGALLLFPPVFLFAQGNNEMGTALFLFVVYIAIAIGAFLILRSLMLWYWKVYELIENQKLLINEQKITNHLLDKQNELLNKIYLKN